MSSTTRRRTAWVALATLSVSSLLAATGISPATAAPGALPSTLSVPAAAPVRAAVDGEYAQRFLAQYDKIKDPANGYFSAQGIPYHSVETLIVEAPDYGHETTSEAYSYWIWLEALYGQVTGDWAPLNHAWETMEKYMIPQTVDQPTNSFYNPNSPATYASEFNHPSQYPSALNSGVSVGKDPLANELKSTYGNADIYQMHWLADVDNVYGFGATPGAGCELGPTAVGSSFINTFQRGPQESVWETVPQPSCEEFKYGGKNGYLDLFTQDASYAKQWKYTSASDADARAVEAIYWANQWATEQGKQADIAATVAKAAKLGDYLRYTLFDKYFKAIGCTSPSCPAGSNKESAHYLLSWYMAWGGATDANAGWAWRIGSSHAHFGYQNPLAAYALSSDPALTPKSPTAKADWTKSLERQLEFYTWLQASNGGIAGGATNSWNGAYATPPAGTPTFYGMGYTEAPVYNDPPSNQWFGMQAWGVQRVAELYYASGNAKAKAILDKWVPWVVANISTDGASWKVPSTLQWTGKPDTWNPSSPTGNPGLTVTVKDYGQDVGVAGDTARALLFYAAKSGNTQARDTAKALLDAMWDNNQDALGVATQETRGDFLRFDDKYVAGGDGVYIPAGWTGTMPNGDVIKPGGTFLDIRSFYKNDPQWSKMQTALDTGVAPTFTFHRFWSQTAIAAALADYDRLFGDGPAPVDTQAPSVPTGLKAGTVTGSSVALSWTASTDNVGVTGYDVYRGTTKVGTATGTTYTDTGLTASTAYSYTVRAKDLAGNVSAASSALSVTTSTTTPTDTVAPSVPTGLAAGTVTGTSVALTWNASTDTGGSGLAGYDVYRGTTKVGSSTTASFTDTGLTAGTAYSYTVRAKDNAGNVSAASSALSVRTTSAADTVPPSVPTGLAAGTVTETSVALSWTASTDNVGVTGYDVYRGTTKVGTATGTSYTDTGLTAATAYSYTVRAKDAAGNVSAASAPLAVTTRSGTTTGSCTVVYNASSWNTGFTASVKVTNTGTTTLSGWTLKFGFTAGQQVTQGWSANWTQSGSTVTATNAAWNGTLAPGQSVDIGFNGSHSGQNPNPSLFTLNGAACS
ncbi:cellulose binding domain-containing protein [Cellulomonas sp. DKR-3]|uniref:Cellulose binding domain-containing protein n=1 Tax=Cellulomonas fulva TaxID=2835530 RepID=A0ABS5TY82_9CELL|nr:glycoside hydrolase family 48 protein [Cellulomonas fulva]MBT0994103.1 cellulose binding domain-containing protein [Cellulomonas fulva]